LLEALNFSFKGCRDKLSVANWRAKNDKAILVETGLAKGVRDPANVIPVLRRDIGAVKGMSSGKENIALFKAEMKA
jgi:hypothetical protein